MDICKYVFSEPGTVGPAYCGEIYFSLTRGTGIGFGIREERKKSSWRGGGLCVYIWTGIMESTAI